MPTQDNIDSIIDELWEIYDSKKNPIYEYSSEFIEAKTIKLYKNLEIVGVEAKNKQFFLFGIITKIDENGVVHKIIHPIRGTNVAEVFEKEMSQETIFKEHLKKVPKMIVSSYKDKIGSTVKLKSGEYATITQDGEIIKN